MKIKTIFKPLLVLAIWLMSLSSPGFAREELSVEQLELKNPKVPTKNLITGGQPSEKDLDQLAQMGVTQIINLRGEGEFDAYDEAAKAQELGIEYISIPVKGAAGISIENAKKLDAILGEPKGLRLLHCGSGNRVGALLALRAAKIKGQSVKDAMAFGKSAGLKSLEKKTLELLTKE